MNSNEKIKKAAAIKYEKENGAPQVVALGENNVADKIIEIAKQNDVTVYENAPLAESLNNLSIGQEIPKELYDVVAQILIFVAQLDESKNSIYE